ncbi:MAG: type II toxin-antitoxin system VapC family toxin [Candidatus Omnitrophota bacterium]
MKAYCLDTFALISYLHNEKGADRVEGLLNSAKTEKAQLFMHKINLGELYYTVYRKEGENVADLIYGRIKEFPIQFIDDLSEGFLLSAARLKGSYKMSYADSFAAALSLQKNLVLVTGDPDFSPLETAKQVKIFWLDQ